MCWVNPSKKKLQIEISWSDGHKSLFGPDFFLKYGLKGDSGDCQGHQTHDRKAWKNEFVMPKHDFKEVSHSNEALLSCLKGKF